MLVVPKAPSATGMGFGLAVSDGPTAAQGALMDVRQRFPSNVFALVSARFLMSKPPFAVWSTAICTGGFPRMVFLRNVFPWTPEVINMPFAFPTISLSSTTLSVSMAAGRPIPKLFN